MGTTDRVVHQGRSLNRQAQGRAAFLWIKYVRDDKNLPSMGSGTKKKKKYTTGKTGQALQGAAQPTDLDIGERRDVSSFTHSTLFSSLFVCLFLFFFYIQLALPPSLSSLLPSPKLLLPHFEAEMKGLCFGCWHQASTGSRPKCALV